MIRACIRCRQPCIEVYPKEDKTIIFEGHCRECYIIVEKERISLPRGESNTNTTQQKYLPAIPFIFPTISPDKEA